MPAEFFGASPCVVGPVLFLAEGVDGGLDTEQVLVDSQA